MTLPCAEKKPSSSGFPALALSHKRVIHTMKIAHVILVLAVFTFANSVKVYRFNSARGLLDYTSTSGSVGENIKEDCPTGSCIRVGREKLVSPGNQTLVDGSVTALFDATGTISESCTLKWYYHTSSLEDEDSCHMWITNDGGATWVEHWRIKGPIEVDSWNLHTIYGAFLSTDQVGFKFGTGPTSLRRDFCWIDAAEVRCDL